jgi:hypothetical protein
VKTLLTASALIEAATGLALVAFPSLASTLLLGSSLDTPVALTVARAAGVALLALGVACWCARIAEPGRAVRGVLRAMALYNVGIVALLLYAGLGVVSGRLHSSTRSWAPGAPRSQSVSQVARLPRRDEPVDPADAGKVSRVPRRRALPVRAPEWRNRATPIRVEDPTWTS